MEGPVSQLLAFPEENPGHWATLVGLFWQQNDISPTTIDDRVWEKDGRLQDMREKGRSTVEGWSLPAEPTLIRGLTLQISNGMLEPFLEAVRRWAPTVTLKRLSRGPGGCTAALLHTHMPGKSCPR